MTDRIEIDFERLCTMERIAVARPGDAHYHQGWVSLVCPFCFGNDGNHLGYSLKHRVFSCWRCGRHTVGEVLSALLSMPKYEAVTYAKNTYPLDPFYHLARAEQRGERPSVLKLPGRGTPEQIHIDYLKSRNIDHRWLEEWYDVRYTTDHATHPWRVIIPVWHGNGYVSYVGRDVTGKSKSRYLTCYPENEVRDIKQCVFGTQRTSGDTVIVTEGVFDALRIGFGGLAVLGSSWTQEQARIIGTTYKRSFILFDAEPEAAKKATSLARACAMFAGHRSGVVTLSGERGMDPASLPEETLAKLRELLKDADHKKT